MSRLCIIGSINMDLVARVDRFPMPGETVSGRSFGSFPGGKGANQAVAAARLGAETLLVGKVGADPHGRGYLELLKQEGVRTDGVELVVGATTGVAVIEVDSASENHIVIVPGANALVSPSYLESLWPLIEGYDIFLLQLEIPLATVAFVAARLHSAGKRVILDPAPATALPDEIYSAVDFLTPNEHELHTLTGDSRPSHERETPESVKDASRRLLERGAGCVIAKCGERGAYVTDAAGFRHIPAFAVRVVDTTAAGDSFNAGFAVALSHGEDASDAARFGNAVGALSTTALGAQSAMPTIERVREFMHRSRA